MTKHRDHSHFQQLKYKWADKHATIQKNLWDKHKDSLEWVKKHGKNLAVGSLGSLIMIASPGAIASPSAEIVAPKEKEFQDIDKNVFLITDLANKLPTDVRSLTPDEEERIGAILTERFGIKASAELDGKRLNRSYGYIGAEQHLMRYPGDTMDSHFQTPEEAYLTGRSGMAPGRGAWGYFAPSQLDMTQKDVDREKYYLAVQTFLAPDFNNRVAEYRDFFKYRKMLVVNPNNGKAVVAVIGDAGPAEWTGKHLGGSPEVMKYLERVDGRQKGPVLYFFIDDPDDKIPLGPVSVQ